MQPSRQHYGMTYANGETDTQRFETISDVLDYAQTGLAAGTEALLSGTSWPGLVIRIARL